MEKPKKLKGNEEWFHPGAVGRDRYYMVIAYNDAIDDSEAYNKWVLQPVVEVFEKYRTTEGLRYKPRIMMDIWKAIQETIQRSRA